MNLADRIRAAQAEVEHLQRLAAGATCTEMGEHDMQSIGGCNAGCGANCACSVPVHTCTRCGDCDYGENDDAREIRRQCQERV
jgi:hypothetical protein